MCEDAVSTTIGEAINRAYVSNGAPAFDCPPQLTVHAGGPAEADTAPLSPPLAPGQRASVTGAVHLVNITATVIRCAPIVDDRGEAPSASAIETSANEVLQDVWAIWNFTRKKHRANLLFASPSGRRELILDPAISVPTEGGAAGWSIPIRVQLDGYEVSS